MLLKATVGYSIVSWLYQSEVNYDLKFKRS